MQCQVTEMYTRLPRVLRRTRAFHNRLGWARLTSIMTRLTYLAVTLIPRVETASSWLPCAFPTWPLEIPHLAQNRSPLSNEPHFFRSLVSLRSSTKPIYNREQPTLEIIPSPYRHLPPVLTSASLHIRHVNSQYPFEFNSPDHSP
jgi:hypothetical protein